MKLKKCVYGLTDATKHWYLRVAEELSKLGVHKSIYDEVVFYWYHGNLLHGIICTQVDDFFWGGSARLKSSVIDRLKEAFQISQESHYNFIYVGHQVSQHHNGINSFGTRIGFLNDPIFAECDPTQWVSVSREVILHFLKNRVSTTKCLFSCLQHKNIKKHSKDEI